MRQAAQNELDTPLTVKIENGELVIRIGIGRLAFCFEESEYNQPYNETTRDFPKIYKVSDPLEFAKDIKRALLEENEIGATPLSDLLDKVSIRAVEDGSIAVEEILPTCRN